MGPTRGLDALSTQGFWRAGRIRNGHEAATLVERSVPRHMRVRRQPDRLPASPFDGVREQAVTDASAHRSPAYRERLDVGGAVDAVEHQKADRRLTRCPPPRRQSRCARTSSSKPVRQSNRDAPAPGRRPGPPRRTACRRLHRSRPSRRSRRPTPSGSRAGSSRRIACGRSPGSCKSPAALR